MADIDDVGAEWADRYRRETERATTDMEKALDQIDHLRICFSPGTPSMLAASADRLRAYFDVLLAETWRPPGLRRSRFPYRPIVRHRRG